MIDLDTLSRVHCIGEAISFINAQKARLSFYFFFLPARIPVIQLQSKQPSYRGEPLSEMVDGEPTEDLSQSRATLLAE